jgi:hypothetical protein
MKLKFIKADTIGLKAKATIHQTGKLGFSSDAVEYLEISEQKSIQFAVNEDDSQDENLYGVISEDADEGAFKISKAGDYYYINAKGLFDSLNIDYKNKRIIYDITKIKVEEQDVIKFIKREIKKKSKEES